MAPYKGHMIREIERLCNKPINNIALDIIRNEDYGTVGEFIDELTKEQHIYNSKKKSAYKRVLASYIMRTYGWEFYHNRFNKGNKYLKPIAEYLGVPKHEVVEYIYNQKLIISDIISHVFKRKTTQRFAYSYIYVQLMRRYNANMQLFTTYSKVSANEMRRAYKSFVSDIKKDNPDAMIYV